MISPLLTCPQTLGLRPRGVRVVKKSRKSKLKTTLVSWSAKIQPKLNKIRKLFRTQGFFDSFCSILTVFHSFFNFDWILALQLTNRDSSSQDFYTMTLYLGLFLRDQSRFCLVNLGRILDLIWNSLTRRK